MSIVLSIDMTDPTGGTGVNAAVKTVHSLGGYACTAITAVSVQTPDEMISISAIDPKTVKDQIDAIRKTWDIQAVLVGMLPNKKIIDVVSDYLDECHDENLFVVIDPVVSNRQGYKFLLKKDIHAMKQRLLMHADVVTPNKYEAEQLTGLKISDRESAEHAAEMLMTLGCHSVLIKEQNVKDDVIFDLFLDDENFYTVESPYLDTKSIHGAGTTLAAAIATSVAMGMPVANAVSGARGYLAQAIQNAPQMVDADHYGPVEHFV